MQMADAEAPKAPEVPVEDVTPAEDAPKVETAAEEPKEAPAEDRKTAADAPPAGESAPERPAERASTPEAAADAKPADSKPNEEAKPNGVPAAPPAAAAAPASPAQLPVRQYLESTIVPILMQGMQQLVKERPEDPVGFISDFLQRNNPKKRKEAPQ